MDLNTKKQFEKTEVKTIGCKMSVLSVNLEITETENTFYSLLDMCYEH